MSCDCLQYQDLPIYVQPCDEAVEIDVVATTTGTLKAVLEYSGYTIPFSVNTVAGVKIQLPNKFINETAVMLLRFYLPNGSLFLGTCYNVTIADTPPAPYYAYWIAQNSATPPTEATIKAANHLTITTGQPAIAFDISSVSGDMWIFLAEPAAEPAKHFKFVSEGDKEALGPDAQFGLGVVGTTLRVYAANYQTSSSLPIILKVTL